MRKGENSEKKRLIRKESPSILCNLPWILYSYYLSCRPTVVSLKFEWRFVALPWTGINKIIRRSIHRHVTCFWIFSQHRWYSGQVRVGRTKGYIVPSPSLAYIYKGLKRTVYLWNIVIEGLSWCYIELPLRDDVKPLLGPNVNTNIVSSRTSSGLAIFGSFLVARWKCMYVGTLLYCTYPEGHADFYSSARGLA